MIQKTAQQRALMNMALISVAGLQRLHQWWYECSAWGPCVGAGLVPHSLRALLHHQQVQAGRPDQVSGVHFDSVCSRIRCWGQAIFIISLTTWFGVETRCLDSKDNKWIFYTLLQPSEKQMSALSKKRSNPCVWSVCVFVYTCTATLCALFFSFSPAL